MAKKRKGVLPLKTLGKRVVIRFMDHSIGEPSKTICEVAGVVEKINEVDVCVKWWTVFSPDSSVAELHDDNHEFCTIVQGTITQWAFCEPKFWREV